MTDLSTIVGDIVCRQRNEALNEAAHLGALLQAEQAARKEALAKIASLERQIEQLQDSLNAAIERDADSNVRQLPAKKPKSNGAQAKK